MVYISKYNEWRLSLIGVLFSLLTLGTSCANEDKPIDEPDFTKADMEKAGFTLGDVVSITIDDKTFIIPYYDGYYSRGGELLLVAYPSYPSICFTASNTGLPMELKGLVGHAVTVRMKEKGGCLNVQEAMTMTYSNDRKDYPNLTDAEFANARAVKAGNIASGVLYRSSTPFTNEINRANYVLNLADTKEKMQTYDMPPYSRTLWEGDNVILCPLKTDPTADDYNKKLIAALKELPSRPAPYVVHCMEGKDRTGYVCALLEGLCGATYEEIVTDYLITYDNYYGVTPQKDRDVCNTLLSLRLYPCLMYYADIKDEAQLPNVDYAKAFSNYLLSHGMSSEQVEALIKVLTVTATGNH